MNLFQKLFLAMLVCVAVALATLVVVSRITIDAGLQRLIQIQDQRQAGILVRRLEAYYSRMESWQVVRQKSRLWGNLLRFRSPGGPPGRASGGPALEPLEERRGVGLYRRAYLLDEQREFVAGAREGRSALDAMFPVQHAGQTVGWLGITPARVPARLPEERALVAGQNRALTIAALVTLVLAAVAGWLLARGISRPVAEIGTTVRRLAGGEFSTRGETSGSREIRQLAHDVNGLAETLERNQRLRHEWMTEIAHELRTPVTVLRGEIEAVRDGIRQPDERTFTSLHEEVAHLSNLLNDLQELALSDAGALTYRFEPLDFTRLVDDMVAEYAGGFEQAEITVAPPQLAPVQLLADGSRLRQLLHNLLRNSLRYTDAGGTVQVTLVAADKEAILSVADSAPGVDPAELDKLFERFFRVAADHHRGGSGLGLTICKRIVQAHSGSMRALPAALGGLAIEVVLPLDPESISMTDPTHLLVVEDDEKIASLLCDYLKQIPDSDVTHLNRGDLVVDYVHQHAVDVVLLDLMLPGADGLTVCRQLREFSAVPIIMLTARVEEVDRIVGLELGADDYVCKPFSPREVVARVKAQLRRSQLGRGEVTGLVLDELSHSATLDGAALNLTRAEFRLLGTLAAHPGRVYSRDQLMDRIYSDHRVVSDRTVDSHVKNLRAKLTEAGGGDLIESVYGVGYRLKI